MTDVPPHPFVPQLGGIRDRDCHWCPLPKANSVHFRDPTEWEDSNHPLVTGWLLMAIHEGTDPDQIVVQALPVLDHENNYTNIIRVTTKSGKQYDVTVTPSQ